MAEDTPVLSAEQIISEIQQDIRRVQGRATLIPVLETYKTLEDAIKNKQEELESVSSQVSDLRSEIQSRSVDIEGLEQIKLQKLADANTQATDIIDKAKSDSNQLFKDALEQITVEKTKEQIFLDSITTQVKKAQQDLAAINNLYAVTAKKLNDAQVQFETIRKIIQ